MNSSIYFCFQIFDELDVKVSFTANVGRRSSFLKRELPGETVHNGLKIFLNEHSYFHVSASSQDTFFISKTIFQE